MPVVIGQPSTTWGQRRGSFPIRSLGLRANPSRSVDIALINNMPDPALEDTELQFFDLLDAASGDLEVSVKLFSLPGLGRTDLVQRRLHGIYSSTEDLLNWHFDAVIITGTEPRRTNLRDEEYWPALVNIFDWAEHNTVSTVLSCLATHAGVLYSDGIERHALEEKKFGVFEYKNIAKHSLTRNARMVVRTPHSRWNEVREDALTSCGYTILTQSSEAGVDLFVKRKKQSLFVHFQGHPEYGTRTLLKEYLRDIKRFLRRERDTYPSIPRGYFDPAATETLCDFREQAIQRRHVEVLEKFPEMAISELLTNSWSSSARVVYRHWLKYVASRKAELRRSRIEIRPRPTSVTSSISNNHE
jgi:homoserine O-succinyltransferase